MTKDESLCGRLMGKLYNMNASSTNDDYSTGYMHTQQSKKLSETRDNRPFMYLAVKSILEGKIAVYGGETNFRTDRGITLRGRRQAQTADCDERRGEGWCENQSASTPTARPRSPRRGSGLSLLT